MIRFVSARWVCPLAVLLLLGGTWFRLTSYGDLRLSIARLLFTFFADPIGVERHVVFSLTLFRLLMWLGLVVLIDVAARMGMESVPLRTAVPAPWI